MTDPAPAHPGAPSTRPGSRHGRPNPSATPTGNRARRAALVAALVLVSATIACGDNSASDDRRDDATAGTITVFAAASLTDAFTEIADAFEVEHPGAEVVLNFGGSASLREQVLSGAPADVFASADVSNMDRLRDADAVGTPQVFATNRMQIAVPEGNPAGIVAVGDFTDGDRFIGLCAAEVPCGVFGRQVLANAGIDASIDTNEPDVRALLTKISAGELDAGLVYVTDVRAAMGRVEGIDIADADNVVADYPIAMTTDTDHPATAEAFMAFVTGTRGQAILADHGFGPAP